MGLSLSVTNVWLFLLFLLVSIALAIFTYRTASLSPTLKMVLTALRAVSVFLVLSLLTEPALTRTELRIQPPTLAIVVDNSESMTIQDGSSRRDSIVRATLRQYESELKALGNIKFYGFGAIFKPIPPESLRFRRSKPISPKPLKKYLA